jgi:hypothetical protein
MKTLNPLYANSARNCMVICMQNRTRAVGPYLGICNFEELFNGMHGNPLPIHMACMVIHYINVEQERLIGFNL